jgi:hypothetical protein
LLGNWYDTLAAQQRKAITKQNLPNLPVESRGTVVVVLGRYFLRYCLHMFRVINRAHWSSMPYSERRFIHIRARTILIYHGVLRVRHRGIMCLQCCSSVCRESTLRATIPLTKYRIVSTNRLGGGRECLTYQRIEIRTKSDTSVRRQLIL